MGTTTVPNIHYNKYIQTKHYVNTTPRRHVTSNLWRSTGSIPIPWRREANRNRKQQISRIMSMMYEFDGYDEILKCYEGVTDQHASTSFEVGLMNDLYYQLFYNYDYDRTWTFYTDWRLLCTLYSGDGNRNSAGL